jgi:hypothetical protein
MITDAKIIDRHLMLLTFDDGQKGILDFDIYSGEKWYQKLFSENKFEDYFIDNGMILWGDWQAINPETIRQDAHILTKETLEILQVA